MGSALEKSFAVFLFSLTQPDIWILNSLSLDLSLRLERSDPSKSFSILETKSEGF